MMIVPTSYKVIGAGLVLALLSTFIYYQGYNSAAEKYIAEKEVIIAQLNALQQKAIEDKKRWEKDNEESTKKHNADVAVLRNRIKWLLQPVPSKVSTPATTNSAEAPNDSSGEWGSSGFSLEGCALDALQVIEWQQWARDKGIKAE